MNQDVRRETRSPFGIRGNSYFTVIVPVLYSTTIAMLSSLPHTVWSTYTVYIQYSNVFFWREEEGVIYVLLQREV